ncbi:glycosyltransferase [Carboxylicivirga sp. A043]|uniref:glycosyltransferase n=1 Tax=Carboxylicivirga litoralis TaxID=2816963 RepID=UPI0021CB97F2|nr:glycosyltransferase [Carboxylicivirga sp. A043]MCU4155365.1 glycosyltransferase [Carboxylicivirga sp. A043]
MKNIGILIRSLKPGGAEKQSALLASVLSDDYRVFVFYQYKEAAPANLKLINHENIVQIHLNGNIVSKITQLRKVIVKNEIQCLFAYLSSDNLIASLATLGLSKCIVFGGIRSSKLPYHKFIILKFLHKHFQKATIFNNHSGQDQFISHGFLKNKSIVVPNAIKINGSSLYENHNEQVIIISVGRFVKAKDYQTALFSIKELTRISSKKIMYYIVGFGPEEQSIRDIIFKENLNDKVEIIIKPDNIEEYYKKADIYLCTSIFEGLSNSIMEALNYHLPVVATDVGDNKRLVIHNQTGFLTKKSDPVEISNHLKYIIDNPKLGESLGKEGFKHLKANYSTDKFKERYKQLIESQ